MYLNVKVENKQLKELEKILKQNYEVQAGIFGGSYTKDKKKNKKTVTVAGIGKIQEFGSVTKNIPARSFIKTPLNNHLGDEIRSKKDELIKYMLTTKDMYKTYFTIGTIMRNIIRESFGTSGDGKWAPNSPITIKRKKSSQPLINTGKLRNSIEFNIINKNK